MRFYHTADVFTSPSTQPCLIQQCVGNQLTTRLGIMMKDSQCKMGLIFCQINPPAGANRTVSHESTLEISIHGKELILEQAGFLD
mmetsp:Transcript_38080/g.64009  ORF Transcript_38080/g.64009 Transcript_38080/m.64009 type:complete len:85 (+) Transcript_38080:2462-2716(+)